MPNKIAVVMDWMVARAVLLSLMHYQHQINYQNHVPGFNLITFEILKPMIPRLHRAYLRNKKSSISFTKVQAYAFIWLYEKGSLKDFTDSYLLTSFYAELDKYESVRRWE